MNLRTETTKAPGGADAFSVIESALLQASLDANAEIARGWPAGKSPAQARSWRKFMALKRKARAIDAALVELDRMREPPAVESRLADLPLFTVGNGQDMAAHGS